ncbi:type IV secretion system protein B4 [Leisingera sp. ANG-M1]|uniref:VirB4 family type IV secretion/conjugal transfer ATPase n=1 Tax=Leisingera sp. ANG-M1 TaxID=1577895 RepID=UPI00057F96F7|nr:type IV secretion system protein B4 [Leisingera sp. ANG-M1]KIC08828.1 type IV secretion system protein B4 [Leisingera sp. ANG-M1]
MVLDGRSFKDLSPALLSADAEDFARESYLSEHMPYLSFADDHTILLKQGDLMATLRFDGVNPMTSEDGDLDALKRAVSAIVSLTGSSFGFYVHRIAVPQSFNLTPIPGKGFAAEIDRLWQGHIQNLAPKRQQLYLSVVRRPNLSARLPLLRKVATRHYIKDRTARIRQLNEVMSFFQEALSAANPVRLSKYGGEWLGFLAALNSGRFEPIAESAAFTSLASQASNCRAIFDGDKITIQEGVTGTRRYGALFAVKTYPSVTDVTMLDALDLPIDVVLTNSFTPIPNNVMLENIQRVVRQMRAADDAAISLREQLTEAADDMESGRIAFGDHHLSVAIYADDPDQLEQGVAQIKRIGQEISTVLIRENMALKATYFAQHPGNFSYRPRKTPISSVNFADFSALHGTIEGRSPQNSPWSENVTVFPTVGSSAYRFNFHEPGNPEKEPTAGHAVVLGTMGTGKTLTTAFLAAQAQRIGARLFFFDKDQGLETAVRALGGSYSRIRAGVPTGLNPLATETDARGQAWLSDWLTTLLSGTGPLNGEQSRHLQLAIRQNAEAHQGLQTFTGFEQLFRSLDDEDELQSRVAEWAPGGRFGWVFEESGENRDLNIKGSVAGFDMTEILDMDTERTAVLSYIFRQIERILEDRKPTIIVLDEAWKLLNDDYFGARLENWLVTLRKMNCVVVMLTQLPSQLERSQVGKTIAETVTTQILFPNLKAEPADYRFLRVNSKEAELLVQPMIGTRAALVRSAGESVFVNADLSALGSLLPILGGGATGETHAGTGWRTRDDFWKAP